MKWRKVDNKRLLEIDAMELSTTEFYIKHVLFSLIAWRQTAWDLGCAKVSRMFFYASFPRIRDRRTVTKFLKHLEESNQLAWFEEDGQMYFFCFEIAETSLSWSEQVKKEKKEKPHDAGKLRRKIEEYYFGISAQSADKNARAMQKDVHKAETNLQKQQLITNNLGNDHLQDHGQNHGQKHLSSRDKQILTDNLTVMNGKKEGRKEEVKILKRPKKKSKKKKALEDLAEAELVARFEKSGDLEIKTELESRGFRVASFKAN